MPRTRTLLLFGAGPGIGSNVAATFASRSTNNALSHIVLLGRNHARLTKEDAPFVSSSAPHARVSVVRADLSDLSSLPGALEEVDKLTEGEDVEVVYYNAARIKPTAAALDVDAGEIEEDFRLQVLALHLVTQHYLPRLSSPSPTKDLKPALLVTNSHLPWDPVPNLLSLSLVKAAQRTQILALHQEYKDKGVHCGLVSVQGVVDPKNQVLSPKNIAAEAFAFWQRGVAGGVEINLVEPEGE